MGGLTGAVQGGDLVTSLRSLATATNITGGKGKSLSMLGPEICHVLRDH